MSISLGPGSLLFPYGESDDEDPKSDKEQNSITTAPLKEEPDVCDANESKELPKPADIINSELAKVVSRIESMVSGVKQENDNEDIDLLTSYKVDPDSYDQVVAADVRGKKFKVSNNGRCPKCNNKKNVFVILDFLFPMGDMPEICNYLITKGEAVLWSSQDDSHCKDPPTFLCRGKCPEDPAKCGFNLNWQKTNLEEIFLFPEEDEPEPVKKAAESAPTKSLQEDSKVQVTLPKDEPGIRSDRQTLDKLEQTAPNIEQSLPFDEGQIDLVHYKSNVSWVVLDEISEPCENDVDDDKLIKTMIALSDAKKDWEEGDLKYWSDDQEEHGEEDMEIEEQSVAEHLDNVMRNYAFSWDNYANNPWAPTGVSKKKASGVASDKSIVKSDLKDKETVPDRLSEINNTDDYRAVDVKPVELDAGSVGPADLDSTTSLPLVDTGNEGLSLAGDFVTEEAKTSVSNEDVTTEDNDLRPCITSEDDKSSLMVSSSSAANGDSITPVTSRDTKMSVDTDSVNASTVTTMEDAETSNSIEDTKVKIENAESTVSIEDTKATMTNAETTELTTEEAQTSVASTNASDDSTAAVKPSVSIETEEGKSKTNSDESANVSKSIADTDTKLHDEKSNSDKPEKEQTKKYTAADFPISKDGSCPHCKSTDVIYVVVSNKSHNLKLPPVLQKLLKHNLAYKLARREDYELPSFQCLSCTYGFNLDWRATNLEKIFRQKINDAETGAFYDYDQSYHQPPPAPFPMPGFPAPPMGMPPQPYMGYPPMVNPFFPPGYPPMMGYGNWGPGYMPGYMPHPMMPPHMQGGPMPGYDHDGMGYGRRDAYHRKRDRDWRMSGGRTTEYKYEDRKRFSGERRRYETPTSPNTIEEDTDKKSELDVPETDTPDDVQKEPELNIETKKDVVSQPLPPGIAEDAGSSRKQELESISVKSADLETNVKPGEMSFGEVQPKMEVNSETLRSESGESLASEEQSKAAEDVRLPVPEERRLPAVEDVRLSTADDLKLSAVAPKPEEAKSDLNASLPPTEIKELEIESKRARIEEAEDDNDKSDDDKPSEITENPTEESPASSKGKRGRGRGRGRARGRGRGTKGKKKT